MEDSDGDGAERAGARARRWEAERQGCAARRRRGVWRRKESLRRARADQARALPLREAKCEHAFGVHDGKSIWHAYNRF